MLSITETESAKPKCFQPKFYNLQRPVIFVQTAFSYIHQHRSCGSKTENVGVIQERSQALRIVETEVLHKNCSATYSYIKNWGHLLVDLLQIVGTKSVNKADANGG